MLGKVEYEQAKFFIEAFLRGQPRKAATVATIAGDKISKLWSPPTGRSASRPVGRP
jgi:pyruvate dehydrogenase (quinone)